MTELSMYKINQALDNWYDLYYQRTGVKIFDWEKHKQTLLLMIQDGHRNNKAQLTCPTCQKPYKEGHSFCANCGTSLGRVGVISNPNRLTLEILQDQE